VGGAATRVAQPATLDLTFWIGRTAEATAGMEAQFLRTLRAFIDDPTQRSHAGRLALVRRLREILLTGRTGIRAGVDLWAYRWYNIGIVEGAAMHGSEELVIFNNPPSGPDAKTTPFCRWVHGRRITVRKVRQQRDAYLNAIRKGDVVAAKRVWPILHDTQRMSEEEFAAAFEGLSAPPYHFFCRTVLRPL
jgi:hypothetical protein